MPFNACLYTVGLVVVFDPGFCQCSRRDSPGRGLSLQQVPKVRGTVANKRELLSEILTMLLSHVVETLQVRHEEASRRCSDDNILTGWKLTYFLPLH